MPTSKTKLKNAAIAARSAALPKIPNELIGLPTADDASGFVSKRNVDLTAKNIEDLNREAMFPFRDGQKIRLSGLLSQQQEAALVRWAA